MGNNNSHQFHTIYGYVHDINNKYIVLELHGQTSDNIHISKDIQYNVSNNYKYKYESFIAMKRLLIKFKSDLDTYNVPDKESLISEFTRLIINRFDWENYSLIKVAQDENNTVKIEIIQDKTSKKIVEYHICFLRFKQPISVYLTGRSTDLTELKNLQLKAKKYTCLMMNKNVIHNTYIFLEQNAINEINYALRHIQINEPIVRPEN